MKKAFLILALFLIPFLNTFAQLRLPQASPKAEILQTIGLTEIKVSYHNPGVKGREVWGKLVPFNQVWRSGANEATLITFSDPIKINGQALPAGTYSLFTLPQNEQNWFVIFNKNITLWGSEGYKENEDVLRVATKSIRTAFQETLQYSFSNIQPTTGILNLSWADLTIPVTIEVEVFEKALSNIKEDLIKAKPDDWNLYAEAAHFLVQQNKQHEQALEWINKSIKIKETYYNSWVKAQLLAQKDEYTEAVNLAKKAIKLGPKDDKNFTLVAPEMERSLNVWKVKMNTNN